MRSVDPGKDFESWKLVAKSLLEEGVSPNEVIFEKDAGLFGSVGKIAEGGLAEDPKVIHVPVDFVQLARGVACHQNEERWDLMYRILWRIARGGERELCSIASDVDVSRANMMRKNVRREIHKMHAFVRFKLIGEVDGKERYVAWFEPEHWIVEAGTPFFRRRFPNMDWAIFTPKGCAHWDGGDLIFTEGIEKNPVEEVDRMEEAWKVYYRSIFNPARLKVKMMRTEMPKRYWKNLPEAGLIDGLISESRTKTEVMRDEPLRPAKSAPKNRYLDSLREMSTAVPNVGPEEGAGLGEMREACGRCRGCRLWERATHAVFGEGPENARVMIVGEQPGDREDVAGKVFVGPAGMLLDDALVAAGIDRHKAYLTNAVKHFKWTPRNTPRGKIRLHQSPDKGEIDACRPWVLGELQRVAPDVLILLGGTAGRSLLGRDVKILSARGMLNLPHLALRVILTVHPSYILRIPEPNKAGEFGRFVADLKLAVG